ncbi:MAG: glycosyltransferase family 2 protein [Oscillospiraceae bacterium]|jgi:glycosyltransferase involved in cell wall biosynthesis|nr:glycosyltransferase family 2 protein [Oscillospiraceae bacterium]
MQSKVSMVVPCYNKVGYIGGMFDSVLAQEWDNIELILVNDGSTDGTREVIAEYEPKFRARGYEVVIVDQQNQGVAAAVRNGLIRVTGEYVCMPDCDDRLHPEYVSAMAGWLEEHPGDEWVVCDVDRMPFDMESHPALKTNISDKAYERLNYSLEGLATSRIIKSVCAGVYRTAYITKCRIVENYVTDMRISQEPSVNFPLALGAANPIWLHRNLYSYSKVKNSISDIHGKPARVSYGIPYRETIRVVLERYGALNGYTNWLLLLLLLLYQDENYQSSYERQIDEGNLAVLLLEHIKTRGDFAFIADETVRLSGFAPLFRFVSNALTNYDCLVQDITRQNPTGRIIAYAAYSKAASGICKGLLNSNIRPDVFWDIAAKENDDIDSVPIQYPDFDSLTQDDTVLLLLRDAHIATEVADKLASTNAGHIYRFFDVLDYLAKFYFER